MVGLLVSTVTFTAIVAVVLVLLVLGTVAPLFMALQMADARRFSTTRWFVFSAAGVVLGLGLAYVFHKRDAVPTLLALLPLVLTWAGPAALWLLEEGQTRLGGRAGLHE